MSLINNDDRLQMLNTTHQLDFVMKLSFSIAAVEHRLYAKLRHPL
jgi:hypothetical protein